MKNNDEMIAIAGITGGQLNAMVKNLMRQSGINDPVEAVRCFNSGKLVVSKFTRAWREEDSVIYFSVTSDGTTGAEWIDRLLRKGFRVSDCVKSVLNSLDFKPTKGITTEVAVIKGMLFEDKNRITKNIHLEAENRKLQNLNAEIACLIREKFTNEELKAMGLYAIIVMHEPIKDSGDNRCLLYTSRHDDGPWLYAFYVYLARKWNRLYGFAFALSQVSV